jgi:ABC-type polysaccharide/polyol phosphate transport system ATPase subunit
MQSLNTENLQQFCSLERGVQHLDVVGRRDILAVIGEESLSFEHEISVELATVIGQKDAYADQWRAYLDALATRSNADIIGTTFTNEAFADFSWLMDEFELSPDHTPQVTDGYLRFMTGVERDASVSYQVPGLRAGIAVHAYMWSPSHSADNFYLRLHLEDGEEYAVRITNLLASFVGRGMSLEMPGYDPSLYSVFADSQSVRIYIDGRLEWFSKTKTSARVVKIELLLVGDMSADLETMVLGLEAWGYDLPFQGFAPNELALATERLGILLASDQHVPFANLLSRLESVEMALTEDEAEKIIQNLITGPSGVLDDIALLVIEGLTGAVRDKAIAVYQSLLPDPVIEVGNVTVTFSKNPSKAVSLLELLGVSGIGKFKVLSDVGFRVFPGDVVGVIGRNGAGKTTLLKVLCGMIAIDTGRIVMKGRFDLLRPGLGMRPYMTGRENIRLAGIYMGRSASEILRVTDQIIEFSELEDAIDRPINYYSDGMNARLVFGIATAFKPNVLLMDELLGAGDIGFRLKAEARLQEFIKSANALVVVQHDAGFVRKVCTKALYLRDGEQLFYGNPDTAISLYMRDIHLRRRGV